MKFVADIKPRFDYGRKQAFSHLSLINAAINLDYQLDHGPGDVGPLLDRSRRLTGGRRL